MIVVEALPPIDRELLVREEEKKLVEVAWVEVERVMLEKMLAPVKVLESVSKVEEAVESVAQTKLPPVQVSLLVPVQVLKPKPLIAAPKRLVVEAVVEKKLVEVALPETKRLPLTESLSLGVVEPRPRKPLRSMVRAAVVEVAVPATVVVAR